MGGEWQTHRLGDLVEIFDGPHATPPKAPGGPVFLGISNLAGGRLDLSNTEHLSEEDFVRWTRRVTPQPGDVVFSYETRLGEAAIIPKGLRCCLGRRMGLLRSRNTAVDSRFLMYAYLGDEFQETLRQRTVRGSTVDRIPLIEMPEFPIQVPSLLEQRAIAQILGTLDDKIELNRRMNETLEAMARAIFKSWFVDFDPVRAKVEGRDCSLPFNAADPLKGILNRSIADIEGFEEVPFEDVIDFKEGPGILAKDFVDVGVPLIRLAKLGLDEKERPKIDPDFEDVTEGEEVERKEKLKGKWAQLEAIVGSEQRLKLIAQDIVEHFERRLEAMDGKAMVVCMSRRICMDLHDEIVKLRSAWYHTEDEKGVVKVVMTGNAAEGPRVAEHARNKSRREALAKRFRNATDPFKMVIVQDMWLTGFDAPSLHTMYLDKPMRGHGLMQATARVNRVFKDKPGGLVVDYLGLAHELKAALATYTESGGTGKTAIDQEEAVAALLEKYEVCAGLMYGFNWSKWTSGMPQERLGLLPKAQEHILVQEDGKNRWLRAVQELSQAFALSVPHEEALRIRDDVAFFQAVRASLAKRAPGEAKTEEELDHAVRQIVSRAVASEGVVDIFAAAGLKKPDLSILSEEFLAEVRGMPQRNLAVELLRKLLNGEIRLRSRRNVVQAQSFAEMLEQALRRYQNRAIEAAQVIEELIELAKQMREANERGEKLGLSEDEVAFYDALETNDSAVKVLGDDTLRTIARELVKTVRANVTIDWTIRENVRAQLRVLVKRILRKYGYPPDKQEKATQTVLEQAALLCMEWTN